MMRYFDDIIQHEGWPLRVVWEYDEKWGVKDPPTSFREKILPAASEIRGNGYIGQRLFGVFGFVFINYNFERVLFITYGNPLWDCWGATSFPYFIQSRLSGWLGKDVEYYQDMPPRRPFRFVCLGFSNYCHKYYFPATMEAALMRNFKQYPATEEEKAVWKYLRGIGNIETADESSKTAFLIRYAKYINSHIPVSINRFEHLSL